MFEGKAFDWRTPDRKMFGRRLIAPAPFVPEKFVLPKSVPPSVPSPAA
jgi:hypothetical protein